MLPPEAHQVPLFVSFSMLVAQHIHCISELSFIMCWLLVIRTDDPGVLGCQNRPRIDGRSVHVGMRQLSLACHDLHWAATRVRDEANTR